MELKKQQVPKPFVSGREPVAGKMIGNYSAGSKREHTAEETVAVAVAEVEIEAAAVEHFEIEGNLKHKG